MCNEYQDAAWLSEVDAESATRMRSFVRGLFSENKAGTKAYTPHGPDHFERVEAGILELIPPSKWHLLSAQERKLMSWAAWTHDIGMNKAVYPEGQIEEHVIRGQHVEKSAEWVLENHSGMDLNPIEAQVLSEFITFHSRKNDLKRCPASRHCSGGYVRSRLLASYLRLADALDVAHGRVEGFEYDRFAFLLESFDSASRETIFHWVKSFVVSGIVVNHSKRRIEVEFQWPESPDVEPGTFELLARYVIEELNSELQSVESVLVDEGVSSVHSVFRMNDVKFTPLPKSSWTKEVMGVLDYLRIVYSPNSTEMILAALEAIRDVAEADSKPLQVSLQQLHEGLDSQLALRNCHNGLYHVLEFVKAALRAVTTDKQPAVTEATVRERLTQFAKTAEDLIGPDCPQVQQLADNFWSSLSEISESNVRTKSDQQRFDFLLFGCSESVVGVLRHAPQEISTLGLWIAECRTKSRHGPYNTQTYVDAERYAQMIQSGVKPEGAKMEINIIPDAGVATLLNCVESGSFRDQAQRDDENEMYLPFMDAVVFGANGIYLKPRPCAAHTSGHLGVSIIAKSLKVPVIAVASALKIRVESLEDWVTSFRDKDAKWLTSDRELHDRLFGKKRGSDGKHAKVKAWNLREDQVPIDFISAFVSEIGYHVVSEGDGDASVELEKWMNAMKSHLLPFDPSDDAT